MKVTVKINGKSKNLEMNKGSLVKDIFKKLEESTEMYIVKRGDEIVIEEDPLKEGDKLEFIKVISGG